MTAPKTDPMPAISARTRQLDAPCPKCGGPLSIREIATKDPQRPHDLGPWLPAARFCGAGCVLLSGDFDADDSDHRE